MSIRITAVDHQASATFTVTDEPGDEEREALEVARMVQRHHGKTTRHRL